MRSSQVLAGVMLPMIVMGSPLFKRQEGETCNLADTPQPANTLTPPGPDLSLILIALGQGTQNYTCDTETSTPSAIGAVATLFNASCTVANGQNLGNIVEDAKAIGAHFFVDNTTPDFDIPTIGNTQLKKNGTFTAPNPAVDVPWLRLEAQTTGTTSPVKLIYRLNTKGGVAPANCAGQAPKSVVQVDYEAQYWVYASKQEIAAIKRRRGLRQP